MAHGRGGAEAPVGAVADMSDRPDSRDAAAPGTEGTVPARLPDGAGLPPPRDPVEPATDPRDGARLLDQIAEIVNRYMSMEAHQSDAIALWTAMSRLHERLDCAPILLISAATKRSGKTTLLEIVADTVPRPLPASHITAAALFHAVETLRPTLLLDEIDRTLSRSPDLRTLLNSSHRRESARVIRAGSKSTDYRPVEFSTWTPMVLCGVGRLPDTVQDRAIDIRLVRKPVDLELARWRDRDRAALQVLTHSLARWIQDAGDSILECRTAVRFPASFNDRQRDGWECLLAIAAEAGGDWPERAREAAVRICGQDDGVEEEPGERIVTDLHRVFDEARNPVAMQTVEILRALMDDEDSIWRDCGGGRHGLTAAQLARLLRPYGIRPRKWKDGGTTCRGYRRDDLAPVFRRYSAYRGEPTRR